MSNIIRMESKSDWVVMNAVKQHLKFLRTLPADEENIAAIARNEAALRSFFEDIKTRNVDEERSLPLAA